jgi:hypothetical protein
MLGGRTFTLPVASRREGMSALLVAALCFNAAIAVAQSDVNHQIQGKVIMPSTEKKSAISRGEAYRNRGEGPPSDEKQRIDQENHPDRNVIIAAYPLDFSPTLTPTPGATLMQKEKTFIPSVLPITRGSTIIIENGDDFYHNVFSITPGAKFNIGRRPPGQQRSQRIDKTGEIKVFCDIHPQMSATILSLETPYFTRVDALGNYRLGRLPAGRYRLEAYHPNAGTLKKELRLSDGVSASENFNFQLGAISPGASGAFGLACCAAGAKQ